nr:MAG TPA: hypothetical protein [Caudoviricetes sp.]
MVLGQVRLLAYALTFSGPSSAMLGGFCRGEGRPRWPNIWKETYV